MKKLLLCGVLSVGIANWANAALPVHQIVEPPPEFDHGVYSVHLDPLGVADPDEAKAYDNFSLSTAYIIDGINWHGIYAEPIPNPGQNVDFLIEIWGDDSGTPDLGNLIFSEVLLHGPATATAGTTGDVTRSTPDTGAHTSPTTVTTPGGGPAVQYDAALSPTLLGAGDYWLSIQAVQKFDSPVAIDPEWQWHIGEGPTPDGFFAADLTLNPGAGIKGELVSQGKDLAFELRGMVPEPSGILLTLLSIASVGAFRKRRR